MKTWKDCKRILCIRPDNMGDLIMSGPAIRALKNTFNVHITVLTSGMAAGVAKLMPAIDDVLIFDVPWIKSAHANNSDDLEQLLSMLRSGNFDAAVIFTVFSQNPLPSALLAYQAAIPRVLAYCRENPYSLITDWVPDEEPYKLIRHQVKRDLDLVASIGAVIDTDCLQLQAPDLWPSLLVKLQDIGVDVYGKWLLLHPGVSEQKRQYPIFLWIETAKRLAAQGYQIILTGAASEQNLTAQIKDGIGLSTVFDTAGLLTLEELICLIKQSPLLLSVNTGTVHIAAAVDTPVVVLYAQTNPQHKPWQVANKVLEFPVDEHLQSKNEVISFLQNTVYQSPATMPQADEVVAAVQTLIRQSAELNQPSL